MKEGWLKLYSLSEQKCDNIIEALKLIPFKARLSSHIITGLHYELGQSNIYEVMDQTRVMAIPEVRALSNEPYILDIVEEYLQATPIQTQATCWWTIKHSNKEYSKCAQLFHQDHTYTKFVKLFLYLNDITMDNGPHVYVPNSVKKGVQPPKSKLSQRVGDEYIKENYNEIKYMLGKKGTIHLVDTQGWHKGNPIKEGYRLLIQLEWVNNITHLATGKALKYV